MLAHHPNDANPNLSYALAEIFSRYAQTTEYTTKTGFFVATDKIDAVGMPLLYLSRRDYLELGNNIKELSAWKKNNNIEDFHYRTFKEWCAFEKARKMLGSAVELLTPEMYSELLRCRPNITTQEMQVAAYYLGRGKLWQYHRGDISKLNQYFEMCSLMEKTPEKSNNFMREYCETKEIYELRKAEYDNKRLVENYTKHSKAWEFEYGEYIIVVPSCARDIVDEGENMHHCVGGYVNRVVENNTYIVFVRRKDNPDKCYITCQVHTDGRIGQYFLAYDRYISEQADKDFYYAFSDHLAKTWNLG
jgi:hypothetical protein